MLGQDSDLVHLPWVGHRSPEWEPEPLRWLEVNVALQATKLADRAEARAGVPPRSPLVEPGHGPVTPSAAAAVR